MYKSFLMASLLTAGLAGAAPKLKPEKPSDWVAELAAASPEDRPWAKVAEPYGKLPLVERGKAAVRLYELLAERAKTAGYEPPRHGQFDFVLKKGLDPKYFSAGDLNSLLLVFKWYEAHKGRPPSHLCTKEFQETGKVKK